MTGTVARIYHKYGYGFITPRKKGRRDIYFRFTDCIRAGDFYELSEGDRVDFARTETARGAHARSVARILPPSPDRQAPLCELPTLVLRADPRLEEHVGDHRQAFFGRHRTRVQSHRVSA
jgi:cold shock CspA family protein